MRVIVIGSNGMVGADAAMEYLRDGHVVIPKNHSDIEVTDKESVKRALDEDYDIVVNTSCLHTLACEKDPARAYMVNAIGPRNLAEVVREHNKLLVHISTDQVFDGKKDIPYTELDSTSPVTVYGNTKLAGEYFIRNSGANAQILRTTALFGMHPTRGKPGGENFVEMMLRKAKQQGTVNVVNDEFTTPTSTVNLAKQIVLLGKTKHFGVFHAFGIGSCSWYEFAEEIFKQAGTEVDLQPSAPNFSGIIRPKYVTIENFRLRVLGLNVFRPWREELRIYLESRVKPVAYTLERLN